MPQLWTLSGINNWSQFRGEYVDYVGEAIEQKIDQKPARRYVSQLGVLGHYTGQSNVLCLDPEKRLDREAKHFAVGRMGPKLGIERGEFRGKSIQVVLIAPKTTTEPPKKNAPGLDIQVFWSPADPVPNQGLFRQDSLKYWRRWGQVWPIQNPKGHDLVGFLRNGMKVIKRVRTRRPGAPRPGQPRYRYLWKPTAEPVPNPIRVVKKLLTLQDTDIVMVGHSQGTNIAMHLLRRGYA